MNLPALPGAPRPSLDRTADQSQPLSRGRHRRSGIAKNPHLTPGFLGFRLDKKHGSYRKTVAKRETEAPTGRVSDMRKRSATATPSR